MTNLDIGWDSHDRDFHDDETDGTVRLPRHLLPVGWLAPRGDEIPTDRATTVTVASRDIPFGRDVPAVLRRPAAGGAHRGRRRAGSRIDRAGPIVAVTLSVALGGLAVAAWTGSLSSVRADRFTGYGPTSGLPGLWYAAAGLTVAALAVSMCRPRVGAALPATFTLLLGAMLYGTIPVVGDRPRSTWADGHAAAIHAIGTRGQLGPGDHWPGLAAVVAVVDRLAGTSDPSETVAWARVFAPIVIAALLASLSRSAFGRPRLAWSIAAAFLVLNWIGDDAVTARVFAGVPALAVAVVLLTHLRGHPPTARADRGPVALATVIVLDAACVVADQLVSYLVIASVSLLVLAARIRPQWLVVAMALMTAGWLLGT